MDFEGKLGNKSNFFHDFLKVKVQIFQFFSRIIFQKLIQTL